jgi:1-acyl-sn-glycerol-3-phosphate acyltransferase
LTNEKPAKTRHPMRQLLGRTWLRFFGWEVEGGAPNVPKAVVIAYPHTSNWDLPFTLAVSYALDLDVHWLGKKSLFKAPYGWFMRWVGGIAVERSRSTNLVDSIVDTLAPMQEILVIIPPEGTRSQSGRWKSGFYWVAVGSGLPIILGYLDYKRKRGGLGEIFYPSGEIEADFDKIRDFYSNVTGKFPEKQGAITLADDLG